MNIFQFDKTAKEQILEESLGAPKPVAGLGAANGTKFAAPQGTAGFNANVFATPPLTMATEKPSTDAVNNSSWLKKNFFGNKK